MPISPWYVGQTIPAWAVQQFKDPPAAIPGGGGGGPAVPLVLTGAIITLHYKVTDINGNPTGSDIPGTNAGVITDAINGKFTFTPAAADTFVTTIGVYLMQWRFDFGGGQIVPSDYFPLTTLAAL